MIIELRHITYDKCPDCGRPITQVEIAENCHTNGDRREDVTFSCGCTMYYSPNYHKVLYLHPCPFEQNEIEKKQLRQNLIDGINELIESSCADDYFKKRVLDYLPRP